MKNILWLASETFSEKPIKYGTHSYAETAEIMLFAWAINNSLVNVWNITDKSPMSAELKQALTDPDTVIFAHNSHFDRTMLNHAGIKTNVSVQLKLTDRSGDNRSASGCVKSAE